MRIAPKCFGWLLLLEVNDTEPLNSFKSLFSMTSVLALGCLCFVSSTAICFFTLLFAVQNPLLLLLIGLKQNAVLLETYGHLGGGGGNGINLTAHGRWKCRTKSPLQHRCDIGADFSPSRCCANPPPPHTLQGFQSVLCLG